MQTAGRRLAIDGIGINIGVGGQKGETFGKTPQRFAYQRQTENDYGSSGTFRGSKDYQPAEQQTEKVAASAVEGYLRGVSSVQQESKAYGSSIKAEATD